MQWAEVLQDPSLQDLPYKIELNEWGQIVMSPASNRHASFQYEIARAIDQRMGHGRLLTECSIDTDAGVKVADVAWCSDGFMAQYGDQTPFPVAPELCVEVVSPSNSERQLQWKMALYFARGARECWLVDETDGLRIFTAQGERADSSFGIEIPERFGWVH
ncbi:MAG: Uma2 family endonuclease [Magnetococcales bacterium]|nr:Uma2 family endonuclease [Magnetococcales bacterium]